MKIVIESVSEDEFSQGMSPTGPATSIVSGAGSTKII